ncbi:MAG: ring-cleaving dioxygenase [Pseudomonadota bacterium]
MRLEGFHHVTAICSSPQDNLDFYIRRLGQRLVKQTVNFDDPGTYHFYYGDRTGTPGSILTFFPFVDAGPGRCGMGMVTAMAYAASSARFDAAIELFSEQGIEFDGPLERYGDSVLAFADPDRLPIELVRDDRSTWGLGPITGVTLWVDEIEPTAQVLTMALGMVAEGEVADPAGRRRRHRLADGSWVDLLQSERASIGRQGAGTFHHVAFRVPDHETHLAWRDRLIGFGLDVTPVIDRQYFDAIYFREPGGLLFEVATDPPGFAVDETPDALGSALKLPTQFEERRASIERVLPPIRVPR